MDTLFNTLNRLRRPEDVETLISLALAAELTKEESLILEPNARRSLKFKLDRIIGMIRNPRRPVGGRLATLLRQISALPAGSFTDPTRMLSILRSLSPLLGKEFGKNRVQKDRINRVQRAGLGLHFSNQKYNSLFRLLVRLEDEAQKRHWASWDFDYSKAGAYRLTALLTEEEFSYDLWTAAFVSYVAASARSLPLDSAGMDELLSDPTCKMALQRLLRQSDRTDWETVALVFPHPSVTAKLDERQKRHLAERWLGLFREIAESLRSVWKTRDIQIETMLMRSGEDALAWNYRARAWNRLRKPWFELLQRLGIEDEYQEMHFGETVELRAERDLAYQKSINGWMTAEIRIWSELPKPWEVVSGAMTLSYAEIEESCQRHGLDPVKFGWLPSSHWSAVVKDSHPLNSDKSDQRMD